MISLESTSESTLVDQAIFAVDDLSAIIVKDYDPV